MPNLRDLRPKQIVFETTKEPSKIKQLEAKIKELQIQLQSRQLEAERQLTDLELITCEKALIVAKQAYEINCKRAIQKGKHSKNEPELREIEKLIIKLQNLNK